MRTRRFLLAATLAALLGPLGSPACGLDLMEAYQAALA